MFFFLSYGEYNANSTLTIAQWLRHKLETAKAKLNQARIDLAGLQRIPNPFSASPQASYYTRHFFRQQWADQRSFQLRHTDADRDRQERLAAYLDREATLEGLRYVIL